MIHEATFRTIGPLGGVPLAAPNLLEQIDAYAHRHGLSLAEAVWWLIAAGLDAEAEAMLRYGREDGNADPSPR